MIRYSKWIGLVFGCLGLPLRADVCGFSTAPETDFQSRLHWVTVLPTQIRPEVPAVERSAPGWDSGMPSFEKGMRGRECALPPVSKARPFFPTPHDRLEESTAVPSGRHLARLTAYWAEEGDYYTRHGVSATGVHLHVGHCAVDPSIIPYGSVVSIPGIGQFLAVDTGSAVVSRTAAREDGHTEAERGALVIDLFFDDEGEGEKFASDGAKYVAVSWWTPSATADEAKLARSLFADEDWNKIHTKQL